MTQEWMLRKRPGFGQEAGGNKPQRLAKEVAQKFGSRIIGTTLKPGVQGDVVCPVLVAAGVIYANFSADPGAPFSPGPTQMEDPPHRGVSSATSCCPILLSPSLVQGLPGYHEPLAEQGQELEGGGDQGTQLQHPLKATICAGSSGRPEGVLTLHLEANATL